MMPRARGTQWVIWVCFMFSIMPRFYTNWLMFAGLLCGVLVKGGVPSSSKQYLQSVMFDENFQMMGYAVVTSLVGATNLVMYMPLLIHAILTTSQISLKNQSCVGPFGLLPKLSIVVSMFERRLRDKAARIKLRQIKFDMEVYLGFYLIIALVVFTATTSIIGTMMFWQMMRVRYILNEEIKAAWARFDKTMHRNLLDRRFCPGFVTTVYDKVGYKMMSMAVPPMP